MKKLDRAFTIGIEEEYQIVDPVTRDLVSRAPEIFEKAKELLQDQAKAEMHQCMFEVGTNICKDVKKPRKICSVFVPP